jgi:hypothetical protein
MATRLSALMGLLLLAPAVVVAFHRRDYLRPSIRERGGKPTPTPIRSSGLRSPSWATGRQEPSPADRRWTMRSWTCS